MSNLKIKLITVSPVISKVYENCLLQMLSSYLTTADAQFGLKKCSSGTKAIYTLRSTAEYFIENNSTVNLCSIDVSKDFDKTNKCALLLKLLEKMYHEILF